MTNPNAQDPRHSRPQSEGSSSQGGGYDYGYDPEQTQVFGTPAGGYGQQATPQGYAPGAYPQDQYSQNQYPQNQYSQTQYPQGQYQQGQYQQGQYQQPAGYNTYASGTPAAASTPTSSSARVPQSKWNTTRMAVNLIILALLASVVSFAVIYAVDLLIYTITGVSTGETGSMIVQGALAGIGGTVIGFLYLPVAGSGNEKLFGFAIVALACLGAVVFVLLGGLLDGDWTTLVRLAVIICTAVTAMAAPSRIETARIR